MFQAVETLTNKVKQNGNTMKTKTVFYFCRCEDNKKRTLREIRIFCKIIIITILTAIEMDKKVKLSLNKTMVSRLQNNEQNSIWGETAPATLWILRKPWLSINL